MVVYTPTVCVFIYLYVEYVSLTFHFLFEMHKKQKYNATEATASISIISIDVPSYIDSYTNFQQSYFISKTLKSIIFYADKQNNT